MEYSRHFTYNRPTFDIMFKFLFFYFTCIFKKRRIARAVIFFEIDISEFKFGIRAPKDIIMAGGEIGLLKKW